MAAEGREEHTHLDEAGKIRGDSRLGWSALVRSPKNGFVGRQTDEVRCIPATDSAFPHGGTAYLVVSAWAHPPQGAWKSMRLRGKR